MHGELTGSGRVLLGRFHAWVLYDGDRYPVLTDIDKLDWEE